ncbi:MAG: sensor histidine kinase, partial [Deltaproteobacteria bacterium]
VGVTLDITERKRYEEIIKKTLESLLEEKSKLAESNKSLERFASVAAHGLRAPIRSMGLWIEMLDQCIPQPWPDDLFRAIEILKMNSSKSSALIDDLLEIAKVTPKQSEIHPVDLKVLLAHILAPHQEEIENRGIKVVLGELLTLQGNPVQWESVLGNLIRNALIYQDKDKSGEIRIWAEVAQNYYHVFVQDNGIGIASQYQQKIFEMFERLHSDSEYPGTGIGLALCKKIVQGWGGQISLDSEPGRGSTFCVSYPRESSFGERKSA